MGRSSLLPPASLRLRREGLTTTPQPDQTIRVHWQVAPGYHLYRDRLSFQGEGPATEWKAVALPPAKEVFDSNFNRSMAVYTAPVDIDVRLVRGTSRSLTIGWQGCADDGLCYPPETRELKLDTAYTAKPAPAAKKPVSSFRAFHICSPPTSPAW